jgi:hypothetical protein
MHAIRSDIEVVAKLVRLGGCDLQHSTQVICLCNFNIPHHRPRGA